ncbi:MAG: SRPBCC family protein [Deltaproteobacteria bacterium]|nr:SRPBCC family protein [Deltaproteobacteria bacterium]
MKALKKIFFTLLLLVAIPLITALFVKKEYAVEKEIIIDQPSAVVFDYIKYLKNQENFSVWAKMDPAMKREYRGTDGEVGFVSAWDSSNPEVGKGEQEIKKISEGQRIDLELRFFKPFQATEPAYMSTEALNETQTKVIWGFHGKMDYPMNIMLLFMNIEEKVGTSLDTGLKNLKEILEKNQTAILQ